MQIQSKGDQVLAFKSPPATNLVGIHHTSPSAATSKSGHGFLDPTDPVLLRLVHRITSSFHPYDAPQTNNITKYSETIEESEQNSSSVGSSLNENQPDTSEEAQSGSSDQENEMGSNVSRHNGKGLSGRRSQSSGNLCANGRTGSKYSKDSASPNRVATRSKFCGSLPNQLDAGQLQNEDIEEESDHDNAVYNHPAMDRVEYMTVAPLPRKQPWGQPMLQKNNTFKCERPKPRDRLDLKLNHAPWRGSDGGYDQGYGSERSPEEEYPPSMLGESSRRVAPTDGDPHDIYPFITPENKTEQSVF